MSYNIKKEERLNSLIENRVCALSQIKHPWNELMLLSDEDLEAIGPWPGFEKYKGQVDLRVCDKDKMFDLLFQRLVNVEPLFVKISDSFKKQLKSAIIFGMAKTNSNEKGYKNPIYWTAIYYSLRGSYIWSGFNPAENNNDWILWQKIDIKDYLLNEINRIAGNHLQEIDELLKSEYSSFRENVITQQNKNYNNSNKKVS